MLKIQYYLELHATQSNKLNKEIGDIGEFIDVSEVKPIG